jgi:hypothetical protein
MATAVVGPAIRYLELPKLPTKIDPKIAEKSPADGGREAKREYAIDWGRVKRAVEKEAKISAFK